MKNMNKLFLGIILTIVPFIELRGGLPLAIVHAKEQEVLLIPIMSLIFLLNILIIFLVFLFLDLFHERLMKNRKYSNLFNFYIKKSRKKIENFQRRHKKMGFFALFLFTAIPLPVTGAYSASLISWLIGLDRKKSIISISLGIITAGVIIAIITLGVI
jgi:uncharacterized membrane protein